MQGGGGCNGALELGRGDLLGHSSCQTNPTSQSRDRRAGSWHHLCPDAAGLRMAGLLSWAPRPEGRLARPLWRRHRHRASSCAPWTAGGRPVTGQRPCSLGARSGREGLGQWPCSHVCGPGCGSGWVPAGLASSGGGWQLQFLRPGLGGVGIGWRTLSSQYGEGGRGAQTGEWGPLARKTRPEPGARGPGPGVAAQPARPRGSVAGACPERWWGRAREAAAGGGEGVRRGLGPPCPQTRASVSP